MKVIVVLGSRVHEDEIHQELKMRLEAAMSLYNSNSILLMSGGYTSKGQKSEAQFMADYCSKNGIPSERIYLEEESLDTIGNGYFCRLAIDKIPNVNEVSVVSSCYHMQRSEFIFRCCFGNKYPLDFNKCSNFQRYDTNEAESMEMARKFFHGIESGDIGAIGKRLHTEHLLYRS